jgi:serine/threonine protein kinase
MLHFLIEFACVLPNQSTDLKADNCFVDTDRRVKVADFGTGRISHRIGARLGATPQATVDHPAAAAVGAVMSDDGQRQWGKTLSSGVGCVALPCSGNAKSTDPRFAHTHRLSLRC